MTTIMMSVTFTTRINVYDYDNYYIGDDLRIEGAGGVILEPENKLCSVVNDQCFHLELSQIISYG